MDGQDKLLMQDDGGLAAILSPVIERIGNKWTVAVMDAITEEPQRFTEIMARVSGISHRMLTITLRGLERDGLVQRKAYAEIPPRVEYGLTPLGWSLLESLRGLAEWTRDNGQKIEAARAGYDARG